MDQPGSDESVVGSWWETIDRSFFSVVLLLLGIGIILSLAASPAVAARLQVDSFYFTIRHVVAAGGAIVVLLAMSALSVRQLRRVALVLFVSAMILIGFTLIGGVEVKGAQRWVKLYGFSLQPSELAKPAFIILAAWLFGEYHKRADVPALPVAIALYVMFAGLMILQPDFGQVLLVTAIWVLLFFLAGMPFAWIAVVAGVGVLGLAGAYLLMSHVRFRIDSFLDPLVGDGYQSSQALRSFREGGWLGAGPGEGRIKMQLPDAHSDFVFSVLAEEYGLLACLALIGLYVFLVLRGFAHAFVTQNIFQRLAISGLMLLLAGQAFINMAVNLALVPAKGMTLPFVSYGGSSLLGMSMAMGAVLALTRQHAQ